MNYTLILLAALPMLAPLVATNVAFPAQDPSNAFVVVDRKEHYEVRGTTTHEWANQMAALGPKNPSGRHSWGFTAWEVRTAYVLRSTADGCSIANARATIEIVTTLPRLSTNQPLPPKLRTKWNRMLTSMVDHEDVHRSHGISAARNAASALEGLPSHSDCARAEQQAGDILRREVAKARKLSEAFDRETQFGAKEGVRLSVLTRGPDNSFKPNPLRGPA